MSLLGNFVCLESCITAIVTVYSRVTLCTGKADSLPQSFAFWAVLWNLVWERVALGRTLVGGALDVGESGLAFHRCFLEYALELGILYHSADMFPTRYKARGDVIQPIDQRFPRR